MSDTVARLKVVPRFERLPTHRTVKESDIGFPSRGLSSNKSSVCAQSATDFFSTFLKITEEDVFGQTKNNFRIEILF